MERPEAPFQNQPFSWSTPNHDPSPNTSHCACVKGKKLEVRGHLLHPIASSYFVQLQREDAMKRPTPLLLPHIPPQEVFPEEWG